MKEKGGIAMKWFVWIARLLCLLAMPDFMIRYGRRFQRGDAKTIGPMYGYRTVMSMKNQDTWDFAHQVCGRLWWKAGWVMLVLAVPAWAVSLWHCPYTQGMLCVWFVVPAALEIAAYAVTYGVVEWTLRKNFDKDGYRI